MTVSEVSVADELMKEAPCLRKFFERKKGHVPNVVAGMWSAEFAAAQREVAIERAALSMVGIFEASDVRKIVGNNINVSPVLKNLVEEGRLVRVGAKKYTVAPPQIVPRLDWTG